MNTALIHPARLAAAFAPPLPQPVAAQLLGHPRFADRIRTLFPDAPMDDDDAALLARGREGLEDLARRAGPVLYARSFVREIRGPVIAALAASFGEGALADARAHSDLGWDRDSPADPESVESDGFACLGAWLAGLPPAARLLWPDDAAVPRTDDPVILTLGPQILRRLAAAS